MPYPAWREFTMDPSAPDANRRVRTVVSQSLTARNASACGPSAVPTAETLSTSEPVRKRATSMSWMVMSTNCPPHVGM